MPLLKHLATVVTALLAALVTVNVRYQPTLFFRHDALAPSEFKHRYGPWAVVAGASRGLGREWVLQSARRGLNVLALARNADELAKTKDVVRKAHPGVQVEVVVVDLANSTRVLELARSVSREREVGLLIYNAAGGAPGEFARHDRANHRHVLDVNILSMVDMVHAVVQPMIARGRGGVVIVSSFAGESGQAMVSTYSASKAFQTNFAEALWWELRPHGVDVLAPLLGPTSTDALRIFDEKARRELLVEQTPEEVVSETMWALGRGLPTLTTGLFNKVAWAAVRYLPVPFALEVQNAAVASAYKPLEELLAITANNVKGGKGPA